MIFIHCNMIFDKTACPKSGRKFFSEFVTKIEAKKSAFVNNKSCYYTIEKDNRADIFLTISGPPVVAISNSGDQLNCGKQENNVEISDIEGDIWEERTNSYKTMLDIYSNVATKDETITKSFDQLFSKTNPNINNEDVKKPLRTFIMDSLNPRRNRHIYYTVYKNYCHHL